MPEQIFGNSRFSVRSRRSSSSVSSETLRTSSDGGGAGMSEGGWVRRKRRSRIPVRQATGLYVHSSPPTVVPVHPSIVRQWLRGGEINRLQEIVLKKKIDDLHAAARNGKIDQVDSILKSEPHINLELSRDSAGTGVLHKAVIHGHVPLQEWLLKNYPKTVEVLDKEKRNPLHYAGGNEEVWNRLVAGGADTSTIDREGNSPAFYMNHPRRLRPPAPESRRAIPQANQGIVVKPSNIRIWIHDKDLGRLQKVLWEGMGDKLKTETSSQPLVRRFLNAVPYILGSIRDVHSAAINNDVELLKSKSSDPVPKDILLSKDANGLNALHKAAGLGHMEVARAIIDRAPEAVNAKDHMDRTPLHYAAALKDQNQMYQLLVDADATDHLEDKKGNTPSHYRARPQDLEGPKLLNLVPDAPRTAHIFPPSWDWRLLTNNSSTETPMASPQVEVPPPIPDVKKLEESKKLEEREVDEKPPEIEPSPETSPEQPLEELPEEKNLEDRETAKDITEPAGISDDEGVGSEANPSVGNTSTPLSDTVNEEEEISGARLGETMTLTSSLFSSKAPNTGELVNGSDSGNEDGDLVENRIVNVESGENFSEVTQDAENTLVSADRTMTPDDEIAGEVNGEQDQPNDSGNPGFVANDQLLEDSKEAPQSVNGELEEERLNEPDLSETNQSGEQEGNERNESRTDKKETEMAEEINSSDEQTDNQNDLISSDNVITAEESAKSKNGLSFDNGETEGSNQTVDSTNDLNDTFTKLSANEMNSIDGETENNTAVNGSSPVEVSTEDPNGEVIEGLTSINDGLTGDNKEDPVTSGEGNQNSHEAVDLNKVAMETESETATNSRPLSGRNEKGAPLTSVKSNSRPASRKSEEEIQLEGVSTSNSRPLSGRSETGNELESVSGPNSRPSSRKSGEGTPRNRTSYAENNVGNVATENDGSNPSDLGSEVQREERLGTGVKEEDEPQMASSSSILNESTDSPITNEAAALGSQVELLQNDELNEVAQEEERDAAETTEDTKDESIHLIEPTGDSQESADTISKEEDGQGSEITNEIRTADDNVELLDRPVTTRSAGGSRAEILAITPAPPDEEDGEIEADDQKAVEANAEEDRAAAEALVNAGDMESMAEMVLNGRGSSLLNMTSPNPDVQLFINNIPQYITKIERVHVAAREGDLRGVQTALDRRKFAVARDNSTPLKPTPLHVAALFGRTSVLRYLAGRFPETMHAKDSGGRTALHYAATLPDNGHFYSLLVTLGADKSVIDNEGRTAEYYLRNRGGLSREELLNEYQNRPVPVDTSGLNFNRFSDKGYWEWNNETQRYLQVPRIGAELIKGGYPIFNPEEGQYLADSLGEPLIKGLTEVAHVRPKNPVVHLANYLLVYNKPEEGGKNNLIPNVKRAVTATMEEAPPEVDEMKEGEEVENSGDEATESEQMANEKTAEEERDREELEDKEDEEENLDDDNASVEEDTADPVDPAFKPTNRDEHGQTILHFAAARSHGRNAIFQLLQEMDVNVGLRDGLYRTARDISEQMEISENVQGIDKFVVALAARGENDKLTELLLEGYDHILDAEDGRNIIDTANERENLDTVEFLQSITAFEERREKLLRAIRFGSMRQVREILREAPNKRHLAMAKNQQGRCSLHVAVLAQHENIVEYIAKRFPATLHVGDNLMRAPLHYAMGVDKVEPLSRILIAAGAQRVVKDLKGRQPSYYFMSKTDIQKLQDEEEALRV